MLFLHGLFGMGKNWGSVMTALGAEEAHTVALDLRNHGDAPWRDTMSLADMAEDVAVFLKDHFPSGAAVVGHSMGGKVAMLLALRWPERLSRLVIADVAPVSYPPQYRKYAEAMLALDLSAYARRSHIEAALVEAVPDRKVRLFLMQNLGSDERGYYWRANLKAIAAAMDDLSGFPDVSKFSPYPGPTLLLRGNKSDYVKEEDLPLLRRLFPHIRIETLEGAGHWLHVERPKAFVAAVASFLRED